MAAGREESPHATRKFVGSDAEDCWEDSIHRVEHDEEVLDASKKAREKLAKLHPRFDAGLKPGEFIEVKAPFKTPEGGNEWMWVEITSWRVGYIRGTLRNQPFDVQNLHSGQIVEFLECEVFDYIHIFPDHRQEGNSTGEIIERLEIEQKTTGSSATEVKASHLEIPACGSE